MVYRGILKIVGPDYKRTIDLKDFFKGPGKTSLQSGEIVESVYFPLLPKGTKGSFQSIGRNKVGDLAIAAVTVLGFENSDCLSGYEFLITLTAVAPTVIFSKQAQDLLKNKPINEKALNRAAGLCAEESKPISDIRSGAQYRKDMIQMLALRGLNKTCELLNISL